MDPAHYSPLLPELFRHSTPLVRVNQPQVVLLDFHGTISERRWEDKVIYPHVKKALTTYVRENWRTDAVQKHIPGLKNESFEQRFRNKYEDAPVIEDSEDGEANGFADQISDFLLWQLSNKKETKDTQAIQRLVWQDGFRSRQILTPIFEDVLPALKQWHDQYNCLIYVLSSVDNATLSLLFENTDRGNLSQYMAGYLGSMRSGEKLISETYRKFYEQLPGSIKSPRTKANIRSSRHDSPPLQKRLRSNSSSGSLKSLTPPSPISDVASKPVLFLTDSGQEAKAASLVAEGNAFECVLVNRPGNKKIRTYYLSQFPYIDRFDEIGFV